jgi:peroxiredoxin
MDPSTLTRLPSITLAATFGSNVDLGALSGRTVLYLFPRISGPDGDSPAGWDKIPGARGCTPEACSFRDRFGELRANGATRVFGLSSQTVVEQVEAVSRLQLPFGMLSDPELRLASQLNLPTFALGNARFYRRLTLIVSGTTIEKVFHPIDAPEEHAAQVLTWLNQNPNPPRREQHDHNDTTATT